jgi:uncharacterized protein (DUF1330 family)
MSVNPSQAQVKALMEAPIEGPIVMVNLLKYRARAQYESSTPEAADDVSGEQAYQRYGAVALKCVAEAAGSLVWGGHQHLAFIGDGQEWDQVVCVRYPSREAFLKMVSQPHYQAATHHRTAGLERTALLCCAAGSAA